MGLPREALRQGHVLMPVATAGERQRIIQLITSNGGHYTGDLTRKVSHLIVQRPEGRKYAAAKTWGITVVSEEWVYDSTARGLILDETKYDPTLPKEERGKGAIVKRELDAPLSRGKRPRGDEELAADGGGRKKLRKTTSMKLSSQRENLWGDILGSKSADPGASTAVQVQDTPVEAPSAPAALLATEDAGPFAACAFFVDGFSKARADILLPAIASMGGAVYSSLANLRDIGPSAAKARLVVVPQDAPPETRPRLPEGLTAVTEFFVEKCLHKKQFYDPSTHVLGRPFPVCPIQGFDSLVVCTGGFTGVDLNHVDKAIRQLGAKYEERFTAQVSVLLIPSLDAVRQQKLDLAIQWGIPVIKAHWLWDCISTGSKLRFGDYRFPQLKGSLDASRGHSGSEGRKTSLQRTRSEPVLRAGPPSQPTQPAPSRASTAVGPPVPARGVRQEDSTTTNFETAPTHQSDSKDSSHHSAPLSAVSASELNRSPSPKKPIGAQTGERKPLHRIASEVADSDASSDEETFSARARLAKEKVAAAADRERLALSTRLTTLLETAGGGGGGGLGRSRSSGQDNASYPAAATAVAPKARSRRRGITGRAVSNVSAASSGSGEAAPAPLPAAGPTATTFTAGPHAFSLVSGGDEPAAATPPPPPATQLGYEHDPDAERYKAELLSKMRGETAAAAAGAGAAVVRARVQGARVTLQDVPAGAAAAAGAGTAGRRAMRRR